MNIDSIAANCVALMASVLCICLAVIAVVGTARLIHMLLA